MALSTGAAYKRDVRRLLTWSLVLSLLTPAAHAFEEVPASELRFGEAAGWQRSPAMASDGGTFSFTVWEDEREGEPVAVYGARMRIADQEVMEPVGVRLLEGAGRPSLAFGGERYLVVDASLQFALIDTAARVIARGKIAAEPGGTTRVVFNGRDFVVFWGVATVRAATVSADGRVIGEPVTVVQPAMEIQLHDAATNADRHVVLYTRGVELLAAVTTATGAPIETGRALASDVWTEPGGRVQASVASVDGGFMAVWRRFTAGDVIAQRLSPAGVPLDTVVKVVVAAAMPELVAAGGSYWLYTIEEDVLKNAIVVRRNLRASDAIPGNPVTVRSPRVHPTEVRSITAAPTVDGSAVAVEVYEPSGRGGSAIEGIDRFRVELSRSGVAQERPSIAHGVDGAVVVWRARDGQSTGGSFVGGPPFGDSAGSMRESETPHVAVQGRTYLVAGGTNRVWAQLVRRGGPVGPELILDPTGRSPVVAASGGDFIVAWISVGAKEVRFARVSTAGAVLATNAVRFGSLTGMPLPGLACDGGECILAWHDETSYATCPRFACIVVEQRVKAIRFDDALVVRDAEPLRITPEPTQRARISAAADDGRYALAWEERSDVRAVTVDRTGAVDSTTRVAGATPAVARQGHSWLLVREADGRLVARWLTSGFERVLTPADGQARRAPSLFSLGARVLMAYERTTRGEPAGGVPRAYVTTVDPPSPRRRAARH